MLDIRPLSWLRLRFWNPLTWNRTRSQIRRLGLVADWLHNLALFSAIDFAHFEEARFWHDFEVIRKQHPDPLLDHYKDIFERELSGNGHLKRE